MTGHGGDGSFWLFAASWEGTQLAAGESVSELPALHGWHVGSAWRRKDQPGKWAHDFMSSSCGLSMGNLGFLTTWWSSSKGKHPKKARRHHPYLTVQVTRCHFNHPRFIEAVTKSIQFLGRGHRSQDSTERVTSSDCKKNT